MSLMVKTYPFYKCEPQTLTEEGSFHSPNFPYNYPANADCLWTIQIPENFSEQYHFIKLKFQAFRVEYHSSCGFDSVKVYDNAGSNKTLLGSFCGVVNPPPLQSTTSKMTVIFTSDYSMQFGGFNVSIEFTNSKECPKSCRCVSETGVFKVDCKSSNLSSVPHEIPAGVTEICLSDNMIEALQMSAFASLKLVQKLYLSKNRITQLKNGTFRDNSNLEELFLARNEIVEFEDGSFSGLESSLVILFLSNNYISSLSSGVLESLTSLKYLFLSDNNIASVNSGTFKSLSSLRLINLANNPITELQKNAFTIQKSDLRIL
ncbi:slit homolog 2 protein-like [Stylophora pistillata]|uniref:slit homolog 2 protein-like n=1 Tax=Stylophora pistillata TaxID=50429 RepID=UPI000C03F4D3|nr:slit homolog 2 protein-like [Stylophora pistillata]